MLSPLVRLLGESTADVGQRRSLVYGVQLALRGENERVSPCKTGGLNLRGFASLIVALVVAAAHVSRADEREKESVSLQEPYASFRIDPAAGMHGRSYRRLVDKETGIAFVLVPGGEYLIGDNSLPDSRVVNVKLSGYYISERQLNCRDVATLLSGHCKSQGVGDGTAKAADSADSVDSAHRSDAELVERVTCQYDLVRFIPSIADDRQLRPRGARASDVLARLALRRLSDGQAGLREDERRELSEYSMGFDEAVTRLSELGEEPFRQAQFAAAWMFSRQLGTRMPTEAEWEVAAQLARDRTISLDGMFDEVQEWCSDHYAHDAFDEMESGRDPKGPKTAVLSEVQLGTIAEDSAPGFRVRLLARHMHVLRGKGVSVRSFAYGRTKMTSIAENSSGSDRGIRLVLPHVSEQRD